MHVILILLMGKFWVPFIVPLFYVIVVYYCHLLVGGFNHLETYEFVNGKDDIPYNGNWVRHVWNQQAVDCLIFTPFLTGNDPSDAARCWDPVDAKLRCAQLESISSRKSPGWSTLRGNLEDPNLLHGGFPRVYAKYNDSGAT